MQTAEGTTGQAEGLAASDVRRFRVFRYRRGDPGSRFDTFEVPVTPRTTVLDAMKWIQLHADPTLSLRHSCFHASCGTCGVRVNGREAMMCVTAMHDLGREITVEPLANIPVLTDLVVDMEEFYERFPDQYPYVRQSEFQPGAQTPDGIAAYIRYEDCIECGLCLSACPVLVTSEAYVGPAALAAAQRMLEEPRGADPADLIDWADDPDGAWRCHAAFECTEACPSNVNPAARIMQLRGVLVGGRLTFREPEEAIG